jgi:ribonuclease D
VRAAVGIALGQRFHKSKKLTTSSWGSARLSPGQLLYAANDAFAALKVYEALGLGRDALESQGGERDPLDRGL